MKVGLLLNFVNPSNLSNSKLSSFLVKMYCKHIIVEENYVLIKESC